MRLSRESMFRSERPSDLKGKSVRGGMITLGGQAGQFALQTATTVVLAHLLTPDDYGLVAMVAVVVGFAQIFRDAGLSTATVQREHITREQIDSLFWVNLGVSALITACILASAPLVAAFYRQPELAPVTVALSFSFLITGVSIQHDALLRRHMQFRSLVAVQLGSPLANLLVAGGLALLGFRYWSLVYGSLAAALATSLLTMYYCPFTPRRPRRGADIRAMLKFGGNLTGFSFVNYFSSYGDNLLVGRFLGADALGLYSRAYSLFMLPVSQIRSPLTQVAMPVLSALSTQPERFRRFYASLVEAMAVLTVPVTVYCLLEADFLVRVLLGRQWMGLVPTFRILAVAGLVQPMASTVGLVMQSLGHPERQLKNGAVNSSVAIVAFALGLPFGIKGVATGFAIASYGVMYPMLRYAFRGTPVLVSDFARSVWPPLAAGGAVGGVVLGVQQLTRADSALWHIGVFVAFFGGYSLLVLLRSSVRDTVRLLARDLRAGASPSEN